MGPHRAPLYPAYEAMGLWLEARLKEEGFARIVGLDEAGRGPLAGPVVAAAVILGPGANIPGLDDSKRLSPRKREEVHSRIVEAAVAFRIAVVGPKEIDRTNILEASLKAMADAAKGLSGERDILLVDGPYKVPLPIPQVPVVKGDRFVPSVAAASVLAKVERDRIMVRLHERYPGYDFHRHKGYPTKAHREAIASLGPSPVHRKSFKGVKEHLR